MEPTIEERLAMLEQHKEGHDQRHGMFEGVVSNKFTSIYNLIDTNRKEEKEDRDIVREELKAGNEKFGEIAVAMAEIKTTLDNHCNNSGLVMFTKKQIIIGVVGMILIIIGMAGFETLFDWLPKII